MGCNVENPSKLLKKNFSAEYKLLADIVGKVSVWLRLQPMTMLQGTNFC